MSVNNEDQHNTFICVKNIFLKARSESISTASKKTVSAHSNTFAGSCNSWILVIKDSRGKPAAGEIEEEENNRHGGLRTTSADL